MQQRINELEEQQLITDKKLTLIKAKEFDKVDLLKKVAEHDAKLKHLQLDNENLVRERNSLDIANVELTKHKAELHQHVQQLESELEFFRRSQEDHLDKFDDKMELIQDQMTKIKNENWLLKDKEKNYKTALKESEQEAEDFK